MATIQSKYLGGLRVESTHMQSGTVLITDAPTDNQGKGESFSPTDLAVTALANCILTIMGIRAEQSGIDISGTAAEVEKVMSASPRRIAEAVVAITFPSKTYNDREKRLLEKVAETCPVALSLHPEVKKTIRFTWS